MKKILIVEDELAIAKMMSLALKHHGYECVYELDGLKGANRLESDHFDLALFDIMLPYIDGYELLEYAREFKIPVIFITAKSQLKDRVKGLNLGADDYIIKPFEIDELIARVDAVIRRVYKDDIVYHFKDYVIDTKSRSVYKNNQIILLTKKEYELFLYLITNVNCALSREQIYEKVWHDDFEMNSRTVDTHIQRLRKKLELNDCLETIYRYGYKLKDNETNN